MSEFRTNMTCVKAEDSPLTEAETLETAKKRKNEREKKRRIAVSKGFEEVFKVLRVSPEAKVDKATILMSAAQHITNLEAKVAALEDLVESQARGGVPTNSWR